ncbi:MAG: DUF3857 domain-containing protein [Winogradskyella sp.]|uniref:DUF3857 domain-containing protein n=1 Tax=Winogradskyella sp. TaxID=1883156 RepID=UPI0025EA22ED|nr:DUF3857 domain-containing protein [Winogradskyella sp.]NRB59215.1 DUF3857 domain-containing protein [Winogradskyella sp.]
MKHYMFIALAIISFQGISQNFFPKMSVSQIELKTNRYDKDTTANALVIYDYGKSFFDSETFWLRCQIEQKIKILRPEGVDRGQYEIKLYKGKSSKERIKNIKATTYNLENGSVKTSSLKKDAIFEIEEDKYTVVKFVLPEVKVGSIITVSYETQSRFISKYQPWYFQGKDPVIYSEYNTSIPGNYQYNIKLVGEIPLDTEETGIEKECVDFGYNGSADCSIAKYVMRNIPAYKPEDFTTTALNYMSRIEYELSVIKGFDGSVDKLTKTWSDVDKELRTDKDFGKQISKKSLVKKVLPSEIIKLEPNIEKAKAIYKFVQDNYKWNKKYSRYDVSIKNLLKEKIGSIFEINLLLENLLSSQGFKIYPILISTRSNGLATKVYPVLTDFNYVILKTTIDGKDYLLDATNPYLSFGEIPFRTLNQYGRLMDFEDGSYWEDIVIENSSYRQHRVLLDDFTSVSVTGKIESKFTGYHAHNSKESYDKNANAYKENKAEQYESIEVTSHDVVDFEKDNYDFKELIDFEFEPEFIGNKIYLNPFLIKFFEQNPFKLQERTYPIDFGYKDTYSYTMLIELGNDLKILETPKALNIKLPNDSGSFTFNTSIQNNILTLNFKVSFDKAVYSSNYYSYLKTFMNRVVDIQKNALVVLEK